MGSTLDKSSSVLQHKMLTRKPNLIKINLLNGSEDETYRWIGYVFPIMGLIRVFLSK
jgi:hypothetical protein